MGSNTDEDDLCFPLLQVSSIVIRRSLNGRCLIPVVLLLVVLFAFSVNSGNVHAASQLAFVPGCMPSTSKPILLPSPSLSPTPPSSLDQELIEKRVWYYISLVFDGRCQEAYNVLSPDERAQESFSDFKQNQNYTLFQGCWQINNISPSQTDSQSDVVSIQLTNVSCDTDSPIVYYDWILHFLLEQGQLMITSIGLYPAGAGN